MKLKQVSVADAKNKLPELIRAVENGEHVTICRRGVPVADLVRTKVPSRKKLGSLKGKIQILDPDSWKPMADQASSCSICRYTTAIRSTARSSLWR